MPPPDNFPLLVGIGLFLIGLAYLAWRYEMKPQPPPDGDHWQRPKPWRPKPPKP